MRTAVESCMRSPHSVLSISVYFYRSIITKSVFFSIPISSKLPSYQHISFLFPLNHLGTLRELSQHRIRHLEQEEGRASQEFEQIHQDQKINSKQSKPLHSLHPQPLQLAPFLDTLSPVFSTSARLFISSSHPKHCRIRSR